jgi:hypothetical protein
VLEEKDSVMEASRVKTKAMREKRMEANMNDRNETKGCQDAVEASLKKMEPFSGERGTIV